MEREYGTPQAKRHYSKFMIVPTLGQFLDPFLESFLVVSVSGAFILIMGVVNDDA